MRFSTSRKIWLGVLLAGITLFAIDQSCLYYYANKWSGASGDYLQDDIVDYDYTNPHNTTDPYIIWMLRSKEYKDADENVRLNMVRSWARSHCDKHLGRYVRVIFIGLLLVTGLCGVIYDD